VALALIALALGWIDESFGPRSQADPLGLALVTGAALALVWGLVRGNPAGWGSVEVLAALVVGGLLAVAFVVWELRARGPMLASTPSASCVGRHHEQVGLAPRHLEVVVPDAVDRPPVLEVLGDALNEAHEGEQAARVERGQRNERGDREQVERRPRCAFTDGLRSRPLQCEVLRGQDGEQLLGIRLGGHRRNLAQVPGARGGPDRAPRRVFGRGTSRDRRAYGCRSSRRD
jgi:hypothetical protein